MLCLKVMFHCRHTMYPSTHSHTVLWSFCWLQCCAWVHVCVCGIDQSWLLDYECVEWGWGWGDWCVSAGTTHNSNHSCSDPFETETEEGVSSSNGLLPPVPKDEQLDESGKNSNARHLPPKNSKFVKTHSLMLGVDRIDEYSQMDIQTP